MSEAPGIIKKSRDLQELKNDNLGLPKFPACPKRMLFALIFEYVTLKGVALKLVEKVFHPISKGTRVLKKSQSMLKSEKV